MSGYHNLGDANPSYGQYNPYGNSTGHTYGNSSGNPYGNDGGGNPYGGNRIDPYNGNGNSANQNQQESYGYGAGYPQRDAEQGNGSYEMGNVNQGSSGGPGAILGKCREIKEGITEVTKTRETKLADAQKTLLAASSGKEDQASRQRLDYIEDEIKTALRYMRDQLKQIKETPGAGDPRVREQVENVSRNLQREIHDNQRSQSDFQKKLEDEVRRRYEIANPEATPEELDQGVANVLAGNEQTFEITGARTRQARDARQAVMERSTAIKKIEQDMIELSELYNEVAELVQQQEAAVTQINQGAEETHQNVAQANTKLDSAIKSARNARRWKWYALIAIIIIIAIIVGVAVGVTEANKSVNKSS